MNTQSPPKFKNSDPSDLKRDELAIWNGIIDDVDAKENEITGELQKVVDENESLESIRKSNAVHNQQIKETESLLDY